MSALILFASTFMLVLALGLQSLNVNGGHRMMAMVTSFAIGSSNLLILKIIPGPTDGWDVLAYLFGGPIGILASMLLHPWMVKTFGRKAS